jgi:hypothetical protein
VEGEAHWIQEERRERRNMDSQIWMTWCTESQSHADYIWTDCSGSSEEEEERVMLDI